MTYYKHYYWKRVISVFLQATLLSMLSTDTIAARLTVDGWKVEYWRNHPIGTPSYEYNRAVIVIHGTNRNADEYYESIVEAATTERILTDTLIVAPKFKIIDDAPAFDELYWTSSGWKKGFKSVNGNSTPAFEVVDHILEKIDLNFPNVSVVSIVGHSAGGQFVQRYGALNVVEQQLSPNTDLRYVVANPSSYMYINSFRPLSTSECAGYDLYKYGLSDLPEALAYTSLPRSSIEYQLLSRSYYILLGSKDTVRDRYLDISCEAESQGYNRLERGSFYYESIRNVNVNAEHCRLEVSGVGHSSVDMFNSPLGRAIIFGAGGYEAGPLVIDGVFFDARAYAVASDDSISTNGIVILESGSTVTFRAPRIRLNPGFQVAAGATLRAGI